MHDRQGSQGTRRLARAVLAFGVSLGLVYLVYKTAVMPETAATDIDVYRAAATDLHAGENVYGQSPVGAVNLTYRYPPIFLAWFSLYLLVSPLVSFGIHSALLLVASAVLGHLLAGEIERRGVELAWVDRGLIVAFVTISPFAAPSLFFGNVNHLVALAMGLGLVLLARGEQLRSGISLGCAALVKVFPAGIGIWLLYRRAWRAVAAATATGLAGLAAGAVLFGPGRTIDFFLEELLPRSAPGADGAIPPSSVFVTLRRPLSVLIPEAGGALLTLLAVAVLAPVVVYCYREADSQPERLLALFATLASLLLILPAYSNYFVLLFYPLVPLLYLLDGPARPVFVLGACISLLTLKLDGTLTIVELLPGGSAIAQPLAAGATALYTVGTPVLWGTLVMLAACVVGVRGESLSWAATAGTRTEET